MLDKIMKLIKNPQENYKRIIPFLKHKIFPYQRKIYELFGNDTYSKPYPGHEKLLQYLNFSKGFLIEIGGNDGYFHSPTYYLEKFKGWKGILVEPLPIYKTCRLNRKSSTVYNYALVDFEYKDDTVTLVDCNAMSVVKNSFEGYEEWIKAGEEAQSMTAREIQVNASTLTAILDEYFHNNASRRIDLLALDVEGFELNVLKGLDLNKYKPTYLLIEMHTEQRRKEIEEILFAHSYILVSHIIDADYLYKIK